MMPNPYQPPQHGPPSHAMAPKPPSASLELKLVLIGAPQMLRDGLTRLLFQDGWQLQWTGEWAGLATKGSKAGNFFLGGLAQYHELRFSFEALADGTTGLTLYRQGSGCMGGLLGAYKVRKAFRQISATVQSHYGQLGGAGRDAWPLSPYPGRGLGDGGAKKVQQRRRLARGIGIKPGIFSQIWRIARAVFTTRCANVSLLSALLLSSTSALWSSSAHADEPMTQLTTWTGSVDFFATGAPLAVDGPDQDVSWVDMLAQPASVTVSANDVPATATLKNAYLYWGGSIANDDCGGATIDDTVVFSAPGTAATSVTADVCYCSTAGALSYDMQLCRVEVSVAGNRTAGGRLQRR